MLVAVLSGILLGLLAPAIVRVLKLRSGAGFAPLPLLLALYLLQFLPESTAGRPWRLVYPWSEMAGLEAAFFADGLALLFALLLLAIGAGALIAHRMPEPGGGSRGLQSQLFMMSGGLGFFLADSFALIAAFAVFTSSAAYLGLTTAPGRLAQRPAALLAGLWVFGDLLLIGALAVVSAAVAPAAAKGILALNSLPPLDSNFAAILLVGAIAVRAGFFPFAAAAGSYRRKDAPFRMMLHALLPLMALYLACRFAPIFDGNAQSADVFRIGLMALGLAALTEGLFAAYTAPRLVQHLGGTSLAAWGATALLISIGTAQSLSAAIALIAAFALALAAIHLTADHIAARLGGTSMEALRGRGRSVLIALWIGTLAAAGTGLFGLALFAGKTLLRSLADGAPNVLPVIAACIAMSAFAAAQSRLIAALLLRSRPVEPPPMQPQGNAGLIAAALLVALLLLLGLRTALFERLFLHSLPADLPKPPAPILSFAEGDSLFLAAAAAAVLLGFGLAAQGERLSRRLPHLNLGFMRLRPWRAALQILRELRIVMGYVQGALFGPRPLAIGALLLIAATAAIAGFGGMKLPPRETLEARLIDPALVLLILAGFGTAGLIAVRRFSGRVGLMGLLSLLAALGALYAGARELGFLLLLLFAGKIVLVLSEAVKLPRLDAAPARRLRPIPMIAALSLSLGLGAMALMHAALPVLENEIAPEPENIPALGAGLLLLLFLVLRLTPHRKAGLS